MGNGTANKLITAGMFRSPRVVITYGEIPNTTDHRKTRARARAGHYIVRARFTDERDGATGRRERIRARYYRIE